MAAERGGGRRRPVGTSTAGPGPGPGKLELSEQYM